VVTITHEQNIICSKTHLVGIMHERTIVCGQLCAGHVVGSRTMKRKEKNTLNDHVNCLHLRDHATKVAKSSVWKASLSCSKISVNFDSSFVNF